MQTDDRPKTVAWKIGFQRDLFVLLFLLRGMPFVDLAFLRRCDLQGNVITYHRRKTSRKLTVVVGKEAMEIIQKYMYAIPDSPYLFPIIQNPGKDEYGQYANVTPSELSVDTSGKHIGNQRPTQYLYRPSHLATTALRQNYNSSLICDAMGHSSVKVTETYFQPYRDDEVNRMNSSLITYIYSKKKRGTRIKK